jgi:steroid delta-isomerase-like uncharacterized protein
VSWGLRRWGDAVSGETNKDIIRRYYDVLWNRWDLAVAEELLSSEITFRGSLGVSVQGLKGFTDYLESVRAAFPDFHNTIEDLITEGDKVVARLTYRGTHRGILFGIVPTNRPVVYTGIAIFRIRGGKIADGWVMGDTLGLVQQLGATLATGTEPQRESSFPSTS